MTKAPFERALVRKGKRALKVARLALNAGDNDSAVSRSYYAMFDIARAALLRAGVTEDKLPRTHSGVIEAFHSHAVRSGQIDRQLAAQLSRTESLQQMVGGAKKGASHSKDADRGTKEDQGHSIDDDLDE